MIRKLFEQNHIFTNIKKKVWKPKPVSPTANIILSWIYECMSIKISKKKILKIAIYIKLFKFKRKWKLRLRKDASDVQLVAQINRTYLHACNAWLYLFSVLGVRERWGHRWLEATANANSKMPHFRSRIALF